MKKEFIGFFYCLEQDVYDGKFQKFIYGRYVLHNHMSKATNWYFRMIGGIIAQVVPF